MTKRALYFVGTLELLYKSRIETTNPVTSQEEAESELLALIWRDENLQVAAVGNPTAWDKNVWAAGIRYFITAEYLDGSKVFQEGYVTPPEGGSPGDISLRPAFRK